MFLIFWEELNTPAKWQTTERTLNRLHVDVALCFSEACYRLISFALYPESMQKNKLIVHSPLSSKEKEVCSGLLKVTPVP